jgi:hypothetical protein
VIKTYDKLSLSDSGGNRWVSSRLYDQFGLLARILFPKVPQELQEPDIPW